MEKFFYLYQISISIFFIYVYFFSPFRIIFDDKIKKIILLIILFWFFQGVLFLFKVDFVYNLLTCFFELFLIFYFVCFYDSKYINEKEDIFLYYNKPIYQILKFRFLILAIFFLGYFFAIFYGNKIILCCLVFLISNLLLFLLFLYGEARKNFLFIVLNYFLLSIYLVFCFFTVLFLQKILNIPNNLKLYLPVVIILGYYYFFYKFCMFIQKFYFNKLENYKFILGRFFKKIVIKLTVENITDEINNILYRELDIEFSAFYCFDKKSNKHILRSCKGKENLNGIDFVNNDIFEYIEKFKKFNIEKYINFDFNLKNILQNDDIKTVVPIFLKDEFLGCIFLGAKKTGIDDYSYNEIKFLKKIVYYTAIALVDIIRYDVLKNSYWNSVRTLANAIEAKDMYTCGHSERVVEYSLILGKEMGLSEKKMDLLRFGGILHDIGKIAIDDEIIKKSTKLTNLEQQIIRSHPIEGEKMVTPITFLKDVKSIIRHHHERWDGTGYPDGLFKDEIPVLARIVQIVDTFDAITSSRSYRNRQSMEVAIEEIEKFSGTQFDPAIVYYFVRAYKKGLFEKFRTR